MTTLIFDWSDWDGPATGHVIVTRRTWRRAPESLHVPWQVVLPVDGRATLDVAHVAGEVVSIRWAPQGATSRTDHVLVPDDGEHLAHLLDRVDPSTLEPLPEDLPSAVDLVARAEALVGRIESGEFRGADGDDGRGITSVEMVGASARFTWTDGTTQDVDLSALAGDDGDDGVGVESVTLEGTTLRFSLSDGTTRDVDAAALRGEDGRTPDLAWDGTRLAVDGVPGPDLRGPAGTDGRPGVDGAAGRDGAPGPAPSIKIGTVTSGTTPSATITGTSPDLTLGLVLPRGDKGETGPPGVVSSASSYVLVGPGRPDTPSTTGGVIPSPDTTPVGAEYRSTDGASVGAWTWRKRPTGWAVTDGDTGWRAVGTIENGGTVAVAVRRTPERVEWRFTFNGTLNAGNNFVNLGAVPGFGPSARKHDNLVFGSVLAANNGNVVVTDVGRVGVLCHSSGAFFPSINLPASMARATVGIVDYPAGDPWPTTLPGNPA